MSATGPAGGSPEVVLGVAIGLSSEQVRPFVSSLRRGGYGGDIVLFVDRALRRSLAELSRSDRVTLLNARQWLPFRLGLLERPRLMRFLWRPVQATLWWTLRAAAVVPGTDRLQVRIARVLHTPMDSRFLLYERFLSRNPHEHILLSDVRDVLFQRDPFPDLLGTGLAVSLETPSYTIASERHNALWLKRAYGAEMLDAIGGSRVSCVGVTYGDRREMAGYLRQMREELLGMSPRRAGIGGADTAIHNMLVWTGRLGEVHGLEPLGSPVATLNCIEESRISLDAQGRLLNDDGTVPAVLHQYDRIASLRGTMRERLAG